jgi:hypothetical protein
VKWKSTATATITENRSTTKHTGIQEHVVRWRKNWLPFKQNYLPQVLLISDEFEIPQLNRTKKIWALLTIKMMIQRYPDVFAGCSEFVQ